MINIAVLYCVVPTYTPNKSKSLPAIPIYIPGQDLKFFIVKLLVPDTTVVKSPVWCAIATCTK